MRRPAATQTVWRGGEDKEVGTENSQRNCEQQRCRSLLYRLPWLTRKRTSFLGTMNCSGRCHCPIARGSCHIISFRIVNSSPMVLLLITRSSCCPMCNVFLISHLLQHRADRTTRTLSVHKFPGIYIWFHCRCIFHCRWYRELLMYGMNIEKSTFFVMGL